MMKKRPFAKNILYDLLINYIPKPISKLGTDAKEKLRFLLKQTQTKIITNQSRSTMCTEVKRNQENLKHKRGKMKNNQNTT